jgi:methionyl-tRNA synthetase
MSKKVLVTSALPYVNNIPHLGNLIGATLSADVYARHRRQKGDQVLYVCGADEHGTATETKAREEGLTAQELCDKYGEVHKEIYDWFNISFDVWGRTHTKTHEEIVQAIYKQLEQNGCINEREVEQLYDPEAKQFLADRFVEGKCPHCKTPGARGDQCDACGKLINAPELIEPISKLSGAKPQLKKTKHLFLDLPGLKERVQRWGEEQQDNWTQNARRITQQWLSDLKERAITRDLSWGVPVPRKGYENKVFYVWFDAPIGYISITAHSRDDWEEYWKDPQTELVQFMGKDNTVFHTVIFPATLLGTKDNWTLPSRISVTEFLNMEQGKFSKSQGTGVFGDDAIKIEEEHGIPCDAWRYHLIASRPETADSTFSWQELQAKTNNELIANLGNLVHRTLHFANTRYHQTTQTALMSDEANNFLAACKTKEEEIIALLDRAALREALHELMQLARTGNQYFQHQKPWEKIKTKPEEAAGDITALLSLIKDLSILTEPFMPKTAQKIRKMLGTKKETYKELGNGVKGPGLTTINKPQTLFEKIEDETITALQNKYTPQKTALDLRVGRITRARDHPKADRLLLLDVDLGDEQRQLVAGLKEHYTKQELEGKQVVVVANLQPALLRGEESQGMVLAGEKEGVVGLLTAKDKPGTRLKIGGRKPADETISFEEFQKHAITAAEDAVSVDGQIVTGAKLTVERGAYGKLR